MSFANLFRWAWGTTSVSKPYQPIEPSHESPGTPSLCFNSVTIKGSGAALETLRRAVGGCDPNFNGVGQYNDFCFNSILPVSDQKLKDTWAERSLTKLITVRLDCWGIGSNALGVHLKEKQYELRYSFCTYESPPRKVLNKLIALYPELKFQVEYCNDRMGLKGVIIGRRGIAYSHESSTLKNLSRTRAYR